VFLVNVPIVVIALAGVLWVVPETAEPGRCSLDVIGTLLVAGALVAMVDAIIEARAAAGPGSARSGSGCGTRGARDLRLVGAAGREPTHRSAHLLFPAFSAASGSITVTFFALFGSLFVFTQYLQLVHGYSPLSAGVRALPFAFATGVMSPLSPCWPSGSATGRSSRRDLPSWDWACSICQPHKSPLAIPPWLSLWRSWEQAWAS